MLSVECGVKPKKRGEKMKRLIIAILAMVFASVVFAAQGEDFEAKALDTAAKIAKKQAEYTSQKAVYDAVAKKIDAIKSEKAHSLIRKFINSIALNYYLSRGNPLGFKLYTAAKEIAELKDDYFTYSMLVLEDNARQLRDCVKNRCAGLKELYEKRLKWIKDSGSFSEMLLLDLSVEVPGSGLSVEAAKDLKDYINRKIVQADERIYMLKEEREIMEAVKKAGLEISPADQKELAKEISSLQKSRVTLQSMTNSK